MVQPLAVVRGPSLTRRILGGMVVPMAGVAILLGAGGAWAIEESVEAVNDRILGAASRAIAESLAVENGEITLDLPASAFAMMEDTERDNVFYSISHRGTVISGYADLPQIERGDAPENEMKFGKAEFRGHRIRIVSETRRLPRIDGLVTIEVAETMDARTRVIDEMLISLAVLELLLIGVSAILIPVTVRWGLAPLTKLRAEMDGRSASDFNPLPVANVPNELRDFVGTFNSLLGRLESAVQGMRRFTADASHQMRTPLTILRTHVSALKRRNDDRELVASSLEDIDYATKRLQDLLVQLLALARADSAATLREDFSPVDLTEIVRHLAQDFAAQALKQKSELQFNAPDLPVTVNSHPVLLTELLSNILDNAIRYNKRGKLVTLDVSVVKGSPVVTITDCGPGIAPDQRERVFERFTRLNPDQRISGSGLGLSIVRALADVIGARIELADNPAGQGLQVSIMFQDKP